MRGVDGAGGASAARGGGGGLNRARGGATYAQEDQILRCHNLGDTKATNPHALSMRNRFHKLYYHYKPQFWCARGT